MIVTGNNLTIKKLVDVARRTESVVIHPEAVERIRKCREMLEKKLASGEVMYGVNTGIGEFSEVALNEEQIQNFQKYLVYNHAAGRGGSP